MNWRMTPSLGRISVLIAHGCEEQRRDLVQILVAAGCTVCAASTGQEALLAALRDLPDVMILNANLPGIDGFEVCRRMKFDEDTRRIPVLFFMADDCTEEEADRAHELGVAAYLFYPIQPETLVSLVMTASARRSVPSPVVTRSLPW